MLKEDYQDRIKDLLKSSNDVSDLLAFTKQYKQEGGTQESAKSVLHSLLDNSLDETTDDLIRDTLDFVVGWCQPEKKIWSD